MAHRKLTSKGSVSVFTSLKETSKRHLSSSYAEHALLCDLSSEAAEHDSGYQTGLFLKLILTTIGGMKMDGKKVLS